jgi:pimeloyl-ACP methyl ester carboxylesterase
VGPGVSERDAFEFEVRQELRADALHGIDLDHAMALEHELHGMAIAGMPLSATDDLVAPYLEEPWYQQAFGDGPVSQIWSERWWGWVQRNFSFESMSSLSQLDMPVLWFLAEQDENVPLVPSVANIRRAFAASPSNDETLVTIPGVSHSFLVENENGGSHYASGYFDRIRSWLAARGLSNEACWAD